MRRFVKATPIIRPFAVAARRWLRDTWHPPPEFPGSRDYWQQRYAGGGSSGAGSYGKLAAFKARVINDIVSRHAIRSVIEFGCGDGSQLGLSNYPRYVGFDVSESAVNLCRSKFADDRTKAFRSIDEYSNDTADLAMSLDVIYHLVEDAVFESHMRMVFDAAQRWVIIYSSDLDDVSGHDGVHIRHRKFTQWVTDHAPGWSLVGHLRNPYPYKGDPKEGSFADFFLYEKQ